ncbi:MAG: DUF2807 domain-containing protein [Marinilabiliales bacterium]|nr:DUF2807 domain-containing protein [Marinilabiliales bacterium]
MTLSDVECDISGSGSLNIAGEGTIERLEMNISGSGDYVGEATRVGTLEASISGSGSCDCSCYRDAQSFHLRQRQHQLFG